MGGLENKLANMHVWDLIVLQSPKLDVAGYVIDLNSKQVKLSHEDPFSEITPIRRWYIFYRVNMLGSGNRTYNLKKFEDYEVLRKHKSK